MKKRSLKTLMALALAVGLSGCAAVERIGGKTADAVGEGYDLAREARDRADSFKAEVAKDNLTRAQEQIDFSGDFGERVDDTGLNWLDRHLSRIANFVCDLHSRGILIDDVPVRNNEFAARLSCVPDSGAPPFAGGE